MAAELDEAVEAFRTRPIDGGPHTFVVADALVLKVRENGRVVGVHNLIATDVNAEGYREILGVYRVLDASSDRLPKVAEHLDAARAELLAFTAMARTPDHPAPAELP